MATGRNVLQTGSGLRRFGKHKGKDGLGDLMEEQGRMGIEARPARLTLVPLRLLRHLPLQTTFDDRRAVDMTHRAHNRKGQS